MHFLRPFFNFFSPGLNRLERKLLSALVSAAPSSLRQVLEKQIAGINLVQRQGREVRFYHLDWLGRSKGPHAFPVKQRELRFATIYSKTERKKLTVDLWMVDGALFTAEFKDNPEPAHAHLEIVRVQFHEEFWQALSSGGAEPPGRELKLSPEALMSWLRPYASKYGVQGTMVPLEQDAARRIMDEMETSFSEDYLEILSKTEGISIGRLSILGISEIYSVTFGKDLYYVVGEVHGEGMVLLQQDDRQSARFCYADYNNQDIRVIGKDLKEVFNVIFGPL